MRAVFGYDVGDQSSVVMGDIMNITNPAVMAQVMQALFLVIIAGVVAGNIATDILYSILAIPGRIARHIERKRMERGEVRQPPTREQMRKRAIANGVVMLIALGGWAYLFTQTDVLGR